MSKKKAKKIETLEDVFGAAGKAKTSVPLEEQIKRAREERVRKRYGVPNNWSVLRAMKMWVEKVFPLGFWCPNCGTTLLEKDTYSWKNKSYCPKCEPVS